MGLPPFKATSVDTSFADQGDIPRSPGENQGPHGVTANPLPTAFHRRIQRGIGNEPKAGAAFHRQGGIVEEFDRPRPVEPRRNPDSSAPGLSDHSHSSGEGFAAIVLISRPCPELENIHRRVHSDTPREPSAAMTPSYRNCRARIIGWQLTLVVSFWTFLMFSLSRLSVFS